jgi:DNA-binding transcriptional ArsR family regulator
VPPRTASRTQLKPAQQRVLAVLEETGARQLTRGRYEDLAGVSRSQAAYDLAELVEAGILERVGGGRSTRYRLARRRAGKRRWTPERIRAGLEQLCAGRKTWPTASEFKAAGRTDLYVAASRYGGVAHWARELGFASAPKRQREWRTPRLNLRLAAPAAALAALVLALGGAPTLGGPARVEATAEAAPSSFAPHRIAIAKPQQRQRAAVPQQRSRAVVRQPAQLVSRTATSRPAPATRAAAPAGPTPLAAPPAPASATPPPLPAPG